MAKPNNSDTTDTYLSEGAMYGGIVGAVFFVMSLLFHQGSYGAVILLICVTVGGLVGLAKKKPRANNNLEKEVDTYKKLDKEYNAFFHDRSRHYYDPEKKRPGLRTSIANGEQVAGFIDKASGKFEPVVLIKNDDDLKDFIVRFGIKDPNSISRMG